MKLKLALLLISFSFASFAVEIKCPEKIETTQSLAAEIDGWTGRPSANVPESFERFEVYSGNPIENASLVPETKKSRLIWMNDKKFGLYVSCIYGGSKVRLEKAVPKNVKLCFVLKNTTNKDLIQCE